MRVFALVSFMMTALLCLSIASATLASEIASDISNTNLNSGESDSTLLIDKDHVNAAIGIRYTRPLRPDLLLEDLLPSSDQGIQWQLNEAPVPNFGFGLRSMWF